ncbi:unannotated protein [freshwater metagenome]|uniref:Unannotated protein n=1 Tax=freshwater metagenome TaxID=449393 RepID=A0A6J6RRA0_9ZZZZ
MVRTRPERAAVRQEVLVAAREVFADLGYHRASLDAIAQRAGYSKGAVYSNFASKDDLFFELLGAELATMTEALTTGVAATRDRDTDLYLVAAALLAMAEDGRAQLIFSEFRAHAAREPALAARLGEVRTTLVDAAARRVQAEADAQGLALSMSAHDAATILLTLSNGLALEHVGNEPGQVIAVESLAVVIGSLVVPRPDAPPSSDPQE